MSEEKVVIVDPEKLPWEKYLEGIYLKILRKHPTGSFSALVKFEKGAHEPEHTHKSAHDVVIIDGYLIDGKTGKKLTKGAYLYAAAGEKHGPFDAPEGCVLFAYCHGLL